MKTFAYIHEGIVLEIVQPATYEADAPGFLPLAVYDDEGNAIGQSEKPSDWPSYMAGDEIPISDRYTKEFIAALVDITGVDPQPAEWWSFSGGVFSPPTPAAPTLAQKTAERNSLLMAAGEKIDPLQDAVDLGEATADEAAKLTEWKRYRVALNRLDLTVEPVEWPAQPA